MSGADRGWVRSEPNRLSKAIPNHEARRLNGAVTASSMQHRACIYLADLGAGSILF